MTYSFTEEMYRLFMIDLDKSNMNEIANVDINEFRDIYNEQFRIGKPIF